MDKFHLDRGIPFVDIIFRLIAGGDVIDTAIQILKENETKHGVQIWYHPRDVLDARNYVPKTNTSIDVVSLHDDLFDYDDFQEHYAVISSHTPRMTHLFNTNLYPFLSETSLVLQGLEFTNDHFVIFDDTVIYSCTQRSWAELVADWANMTKWCKKDNWYYSDFYSNLENIVVDYKKWERTVLLVIQEKCERALQKS